MRFPTGGWERIEWQKIWSAKWLEGPVPENKEKEDLLLFNFIFVLFFPRREMVIKTA